MSKKLSNKLTRAALAGLLTVGSLTSCSYMGKHGENGCSKNGCKKSEKNSCSKNGCSKNGCNHKKK